MLSGLFRKSQKEIETELRAEFNAQQLAELHSRVVGTFYNLDYASIQFHQRAHDVLEQLKKTAIASGQSQRVEFGDGRSLCVTVKRGKVVNFYSEGF